MITDFRREVDSTMTNWAGYAPLRAGRIHFYCLGCRRKLSNMPRQDYDPPRAELCQSWCPACQEGCKDVPEYFLDRQGKQIAWEEIQQHIERAR